MIFYSGLSDYDAGYLVDATLYDLDGDHRDRVVDEDQVGNDDCPSSLNTGEVAEGGVGGVEGVTSDVEDEVVEGESLDAGWEGMYDLSL